MKFRTKRASSLRFQSALRRMIERREAELSSPNYALLQHESNRKFPQTSDTGSSGFQPFHLRNVRMIDPESDEGDLGKG
jgi:hypothetical protein